MRWTKLLVACGATMLAAFAGCTPMASQPLQTQGPLVADVPGASSAAPGKPSTKPRRLDELLIFVPSKFPEGNWRPARLKYEDCWFTASDGVRLHGWYCPQQRPAAVVLYMHGNGGNLTYCAEYAALLGQRFHLSVMLFDYRGYGRSEGAPTVEGVLRDARAAREWLAQREGIAAKDIVLWGRSLGGAVAVDLAADGARALVLESTFSSLREAAGAHYPRPLVRLLVADRLNSAEKIRQYHGPLLQSHGDADRTVPYALGQRLFQAANEPKRFITIPRGDHNDPQNEGFFRAVEELLVGFNP